MYWTSDGLKMTREEYDEHAKFCAKMDIDKLKRNIGKLVIIKCKQDGDKRVYVGTFEACHDALTKYGWWNTFTLAENPVEHAGLYLAVIKDFKLDKNGFLNMHVDVRYNIDNLNPHSDAWDYFRYTGMFAREYMKANKCGRFNVEELERYFEKKNFESDSMFAKRLLGLWMAGTITEKEILDCLNAPTDREKEIEAIIVKSIRENKEFCERYILTSKKIRAEYDAPGFGFENAKDWLYRKEREYDTLKLGDDNKELAEKTELVCLYWKNKKLAEKEAKRQARLAAKASKN